MEAWWLAFSLHEVEQRINAGDDGAVLDGIAICAMNKTPLPYWLADAFLGRRARVADYEAGSWDDVFGRPHKAGTHLEKAQKKKSSDFIAFFRVREIIQTGHRGQRRTFRASR